MRDCMAAGIFAEGDPMPVTLQLWAAAHGIASLMIAKPFLPWGGDRRGRRRGAVLGRAGAGDRRPDRRRRRARARDGRGWPSSAGADRGAAVAAARAAHHRSAEFDGAVDDPRAHARARPRRVRAHRHRRLRTRVPVRGQPRAPGAADGGRPAGAAGRTARGRRAGRVRAVPARVHRLAPARGCCPPPNRCWCSARATTARAYRFAAEIGPRPVYEVDLAPLSRRKAAIVAAHADLFGPCRGRTRRDRLPHPVAGRPARRRRLRRAPPDLRRVGGREHVPVTRTPCARRCARWRHCAAADRCWRWTSGSAWAAAVPTTGCGRLGERSIRLIGEPITFAVPPDEAGALLAAAGFEIADLAEAGEMTARYATAGRHCDAGMYVVAARRR